MSFLQEIKILPDLVIFLEISSFTLLTSVFLSLLTNIIPDEESTNPTIGQFLTSLFVIKVPFAEPNNTQTSK